MRVSASATVRGSREWLVWSDGLTYASLGAATSAAEALLGPGVPLRTALIEADEAEVFFRAVFARLRTEPNVLRDGEPAAAVEST